jgi:hypothetical protein
MKEYTDSIAFAMASARSRQLSDRLFKFAHGINLLAARYIPSGILSFRRQFRDLCGADNFGLLYAKFARCLSDTFIGWLNTTLGWCTTGRTAKAFRRGGLAN